MPRETILIDGESVTTLVELLRPGLSAVFVGINPSPVSVSAGHYYQGRLGKRLWSRLAEYGIASEAFRSGMEDTSAFEQGFGFADLIRTPTKRAAELSMDAKRAAVEDLVSRLCALPDRPLVLFVFKEPFDLCGGALGERGFEVACLPGPYASKEVERMKMQAIRGKLSVKRTP